jgi:hypothetical protein
MRDFELPGLGLGYYQMVTAMTAWCVSAMNMDLGSTKNVKKVNIELTNNVNLRIHQ